MDHSSGEAPEKGVRLAKYLASAGIGSRRSCEEYIQEGRVTVNGEAVTKVGTCVSPGEDEVRFEGKLVSPDGHSKVYLMLNKPAGYTCSAQDVHAAKLVYQLIPERFGRLFTVGRLDRDSEGLLLLTNDGEFAQRLTHPSHEIYKRYYVECVGRFTTAIRRRLLDGMYDNGEFLQALNVEQVSVQYGSCKLVFTLGEGRKREVRRLCKDVGLKVRLLRRIAIGQLELDPKLTLGSWRVMSPHDCELALSPLEVPERPRPSQPPRPYWVKDKPEREKRSPRGIRGGSPAHRDESDNDSPRDSRGPVDRGRGGHARSPRPSFGHDHAPSSTPWYERDDSPEPEAEEYLEASPRRQWGYGNRHDGDDFRPQRGKSRGAARNPRGEYGERPRVSRKKDSSANDSYSAKGRDYRRNKPPRSWR
ncbi:MAG: rRNA pseudouridine synthase [Victivallales bacterium]|nr:rRNA pseudouridine synthase [Victivallales bacterium]